MLKTIVIGRLGKDATSNDVNGRSVINFSVAHTETWKDKQTGEKKSSTTWLNCSYWTDRTAIVPYLKKGILVCVEGKPSARPYSANGQNNASLELQVLSVQLLSSQEQQPAQQAEPKSTSTWNQQSETPPVDNDDLPF